METLETLIQVAFIGSCGAVFFTAVVIGIELCTGEQVFPGPDHAQD